MCLTLIAVGAFTVLRTDSSFSLSALNWAFLRCLQTAWQLSVLCGGSRRDSTGLSLDLGSAVFLRVMSPWAVFGSVFFT